MSRFANSSQSMHGGNLAEHADCCGHMHWWRHLSDSTGRKPFALPGTPRQYAPDLTVTVHHTKLVLDVDPVAKTLVGHCLTTVEPIAEPINSVFFASQNLKIESATLAGSSDALSMEEVDKGFIVHLPKQLQKGEKVTIDLAYRTLTPKLGIYFTGPSPLYPGKP